MISRLWESVKNFFGIYPNFRSMNGSDIADIAHIPTDKEIYYWSVYFEAKDQGYTTEVAYRLAVDKTLAKFFLYGKPAA